MEIDHFFMAIALREAKKGVGLTSPNPPVGAVIVSPAGTVLGKGWHHGAGQPHAEREAITAAGGPSACAGATLYITLEPCSTHGRTPPCVDAVIEARFARVVWATDDPNPAHAGRAANHLTERGLQVTRGVLEEEARQLLAPWRKFITTGRPWVIAKAGLSLDGKLTRPGAKASGSPTSSPARMRNGCAARPTLSSSGQRLFEKITQHSPCARPALGNNNLGAWSCPKVDASQPRPSFSPTNIEIVP